MRRLNEPSHLDLCSLTYSLSTLHINVFPSDSFVKIKTQTTEMSSEIWHRKSYTLSTLIIKSVDNKWHFFFHYYFKKKLIVLYNSCESYFKIHVFLSFFFFYFFFSQKLGMNSGIRHIEVRLIAFHVAAATMDNGNNQVRKFTHGPCYPTVTSMPCIWLLKIARDTAFLTKLHVHPAKTDQPAHPRILIRDLLFAWTRFELLATHRTLCEDSGQTAWTRGLTCVFAGRTCSLVGNAVPWLSWLNVHKMHFFISHSW